MARKIATSDTVDRAAMVDFIRPRHRAVLLTRRRNGDVQGSPVTCGVDGDGRLVVSTYPGRAKAANVARDPWAAAVVVSDEWDGPWVQVEGPAEMLTLPDALDPLVDYFRAVSGEHPDWNEYRSAMADQGKALIRITIERWSPIATGGFPADPADGG